MTNVERWAYIRAERAKTPPKGYRVLARELGIDPPGVIRIAKQEHPPTRDTTPIRLEQDKEYGKLTFLEPAPTPPGKKGRHGRFRCRCGTECVLLIYAVKWGNNTSCGCQAAWASSHRPYDHTCVVCHKAFQGGPNARVCGAECKRARWRLLGKIARLRKKNAEGSAAGG